MTLPGYAHIMLDELGVAEWPGPESNPEVLKYIDCTPLRTWSRNDEVAWCGAFQAFGVVNAGLEPPTLAHRAREWRFWGRRADPDERVGSVCVLQLKRRTAASRRRTGSARGGYHVGTVLGFTPRGVILVSGNTKNRVGVDVFSFRKWRRHAYRVVNSTMEA